MKLNFFDDFLQMCSNILMTACIQNIFYYMHKFSEDFVSLPYLWGKDCIGLLNAQLSLEWGKNLFYISNEDWYLLAPINPSIYIKQDFFLIYLDLCFLVVIIILAHNIDVISVVMIDIYWL